MSRGRILIVEDEYLVAADVEAALEDRGFETAGIASDMTTALSLAETRPDLALVDIHLRDGPSGPEIARRLSEDYGVPVIFVTANPTLIREKPASRVLGVLEKPCGEDLIAAALDYAITRSKDFSPPPEGLRLFPSDV